MQTLHEQILVRYMNVALECKLVPTQNEHKLFVQALTM